MSFSKEERQKIVQAILGEIDRSPKNPTGEITQRFGISRQTVSKYLSELIANNDVSVIGTKRNAQYSLQTVNHYATYRLKDLQEDHVWSEFVKPLLSDIPDNVMRACNYGFTEILNNAIDHSEADQVYISVRLSKINIGFLIRDEGVGIFHKIQIALSLEDPKHAILELAKGKFTTASDKHTGEGIFFTSRIFDKFFIFSQTLTFAGGRRKIDFLWDDDDMPMKGTVVSMEINKNSDVQIKDVFDQFSVKDSCNFSKTHIPVKLVGVDEGLLVSRSQAKRLMQRFDCFKEIILDFEGISEIGQGFADELFRVFKNEHPDIHLIPVQMSKEVEKMVNRVRNNN
jgi:anti-sigma regulatory factor (Ser/Thr protein kinase)/predicted transcriptional regulator